MPGMCFGLSILLIPAVFGAQADGVAEQDRAAIVRAVLDYAEGYYGGEPPRMAQAVSPLLAKRAWARQPGAPAFLTQMNADMLVDASHGVKLAPPERRITTEVLGVTNEIASARVFTARFNDYLHLVKRDGSWRIVNVLWHAPPAAAATAEAAPAPAAVETAVRAFAGALVAADREGLRAVLHPLALLRTLAPPREGRPRVLREQTADGIAYALGAGQIKVGARLEDVRIAVDGVDTDIAAATMTMGATTTYLHLAMDEGRWRVVNTLGYPPAPAAGTATR